VEVVRTADVVAVHLRVGPQDMVEGRHVGVAQIHHGLAIGALRAAVASQCGLREDGTNFHPASVPADAGSVEA
jgi:hypothetical protein